MSALSLYSFLVYSCQTPFSTTSTENLFSISFDTFSNTFLTSSKDLARLHLIFLLAYSFSKEPKDPKSYQVVCPSIVKTQEDIRQLKSRMAEMFSSIEKLELRLLAQIKRGYPTKDDVLYDQKILEKPVRNIIEEYLEEKERLG